MTMPPAAAAAAAPDPTVATVDGPHAEQLREAAAALLGVPVDQMPSAADLLGTLTAPSTPAPLSDDERAAAAQAHRDAADRDLDASLASAEHTRAHAQSLIDAADAMEAQAREEHGRAMRNADRIGQAEALEPPPAGQPAGPSEPAGPAEGEQGGAA